jgi:hypothetical protein
LYSQVSIGRSFNFNCCINDHGLIFISISKTLFFFSLTGKFQKTFYFENDIRQLVDCESFLLVILNDNSLYHVNLTYFEQTKLLHIQFLSVSPLPFNNAFLYFDSEHILTKYNLNSMKIQSDESNSLLIG